MQEIGNEDGLDICSDIKVTVNCIAFNHEEYIADAIEGFLMQETDFFYEIFIHDDASIGRTAEIIKQYEKKYPDKIKGIYQKQNQYSQGVAILFDILLPMAHGKYVALCEGDDYWTDPHKLQRQVEAMERCCECDLCAHATAVVDARTKQIIDEIKPSDEKYIFMPEEIIAGGGGFVATNSLMIKKEQMERDADLIREFPLDYFIQIMGSIRGGMLYLADSMSCYRWMAKGSWSERMQNDLQGNIDFLERYCAMLKKINIRTDDKYKNVIEKVIEKKSICKLELKGEYKCIIKYYPQALNKMSCRQRLRIYINAYFPWVKILCDRIMN